MSNAISVLFDEPGPRARRRIRLFTVLGSAIVLALIVGSMVRLAANGQLTAQRWQGFLQPSVLRFLGEGAVATLQVTAAAAAIAFPLGGLLALGRLSTRRTVRGVCRGYVELFRAVPLLLFLYIALFVLPRAGLTLPIFWQLAGSIAVSQAAVIAELFRAGLLAVPAGQTEAATALGLRHGQTLRLVVIPQALPPLTPALISQLVRVLKDSTLGYVVSYTELLHQAKVLGEYQNNLLPTYLVVAAVYVVLNTALSALAAFVKEKAFVSHDRRRGRGGDAAADAAGASPRAVPEPQRGA